MAAPADPHSEKIADAILAAFGKIQEVDGYWTTPAIVGRYDREESARNDRPSITFIKTGEGKRIRAGSSDYWDSELRFSITGLISSIADEPTIPTDRLVANLEDDIGKALDSVDWNGLRARQAFRDSRNLLVDDPEDPEDGVIVDVMIQYSHKQGDSSSPLAP